MTGRNEPCPCGSGKKYKKCCQNQHASSQYSQEYELNQLAALFNAGRYAESEMLAARLVKQYPDSGMVWKLLGYSLMVQTKDAVTALRKATRYLPDDAELHNYLGIVLTSQNSPVDAEVQLRRALEIRPDYAEACHNLAIALMAQKRMVDAEVSVRQALKIQPEYPKALYTLSLTQIAQERLSDAKESLRHALEIKPDFTVASFALAGILMEQGYPSQAEALFRHVLQDGQNNVDALFSLATVLLEQGRLSEANETFHSVLQLDPNHLETRHALAMAGKVKEGDENLAALLVQEQLLRDRKLVLPAKKEMALYFALGKCFDDLGDYQKAFEFFEAGCRIKRSTIDYSPEETTLHFAQIKRVFDQAAFDRLRGGGDPLAVPIFVLGMPRSGTTMVVQMLSCHADVYGAGELPDLLDIAKRNVDNVTYPENILALNSAQLGEWGAEYVAGLRARESESPHIVDKMPINFTALGLIHLMLPNAKIIHVKRNPVDTCLSCFSLLFKQQQDFSYDLAELGRYYADYVDLMAHWRRVLPADAFIEVQYENIVSDQAGQARRLIEYCGLEWDESCLDFHKNKRAVRTASLMQVRRPLYQTSVERWRNYENNLTPLLDALGELVPGRES